MSAWQVSGFHCEGTTVTDVTSLDKPSRSSWRDASLVRVLGSGLGWYLFGLSMTLLQLSTLTVVSIGGSCASGGPYQIAVPCPESVAAFAPLSVFGGLIAVGLWVYLAQGFGMPLPVWAWTILFCGLGALFLAAFFATGDPVGLILGIMFEIMGLVPLVIELRGSAQRVFVGQVSATGRQFYEGDRARTTLMSRRSPNPDGAVRPTALNWIASVGIALLCGAGGYLTAVAWFGSLAAVPQ